MADRISTDDLLDRYIRYLRIHINKTRRGNGQDREGWWDGFTNAVDMIKKELPTILALADKEQT